VFLQVLNGFTKDVYDSDVELYGTTLRLAIATTMQGMTASSIANLVVTAESTESTARMTAESRRAIRRALQESTAVSLAYTVAGTSRYSASNLAEQLQAALVSGAFDASLHAIALQNGAVGLLNATSNSATTDIDDGSDSTTLSTGAIVSIVIGCVVFVGIVGGGIALWLIWYFYWRKNGSLLQVSDLPLVNL